MMSERTAVQDPMLRYADAMGWGVVACDAKIAALERERALLEALMTGRVAVDLQGLQAETELP